MNSGTRSKRVDQSERKWDLLNAVEGTPSHHKAAIVSRIMKEVVAGRISVTEVSEMTRAVKTGK